MKKLATFAVFIHLLIAVVSGQECTDTVTVGSLSHDNNIVTQGQTFILAGYTVPCSGTVVAWEFCHLRVGATVTFYPGIWRINKTSGNTDYTLVQSNTVTYDSSISDPQDPTSIFSCQRFNLSDADQFTAPAGSVVGLYSNVGTQLLHTDDTNSSITTHQFNGNQSSVITTGNSNDINYNIAIRVHLISTNIIVTPLLPTTSTAPITSTITVATTMSILSTSDTTTVTPTTSIVPNTVTPVISTTAISDDVSNNSGSTSDSIAIIGGAVGGVILFLMITVVLCIVILCVRRSHRKGTFPVDNTAKLNENVTIDNNPAYDITKANTVGSLYSTIKPGDSDVPITANPSYVAPNKPYSKACEDEYNYVQPNQHSDLGLTTGDRATAFSAHSADTKATTKQCDYDYVCDDRLLHHNTAANTTGDVKKDIPTSVDQSGHYYMENVHPLCIADSAQPSNEDEYSVVNHV